MGFLSIYLADMLSNLLKWDYIQGAILNIEFIYYFKCITSPDWINIYRMEIM